MPGWKRDAGRRLDALNVRRAVKWNSPFYGIEGQGWFVSFHTFTNYVPQPPTSPTCPQVMTSVTQFS
jgi:hypothetical protein